MAPKLTRTDPDPTGKKATVPGRAEAARIQAVSLHVSRHNDMNHLEELL